MSRKNEVTYKRTASRNGRGSAARSVFGCSKNPARSLAMLATAGLLSGVSLQCMAADFSNHIFSGCTFKTADLQSILSISGSPFVGGVQASYILIYVRGNPNDGQALKSPAGAFTGPILCVNSGTEVVPPVQTTEGTPIPNLTGATVDILGGEEALHLQYLVHAPLSSRDGHTEKRVCHTVAGNTDCFLIQPR
jgi:hypothetical protein